MLFLNNWHDEECEQNRLAAGPSDFQRDLADRVYTSRLIGKVPDLVMHGGGNTSCKTTKKNLFGEKIDVLCVKGSGWDLETIEAAGLPAVKLAPLLKLRQLSKLSDEDMVNVQRANLPTHHRQTHLSRHYFTPFCHTNLLITRIQRRFWLLPTCQILWPLCARFLVQPSPWCLM